MEQAHKQLRFFAFRSLDTEIWARFVAAKIPAREQVRSLWFRLAKLGFPAPEIGRLGELWGALEDAPFDYVYQNYLLHPLRVAYSLTLESETAGPEWIATALCHNFRELAQFPALSRHLDDIEAEFLGDKSRHALDLLFTDRTQQEDADYMASYFGALGEESPSLMILKGWDKLDNHLSYAFEFLDPFHHQVVKRFVTPALRQTRPRLAAYLDQLVEYVEIPATVSAFQARSESCS